MFSLFEYGSIFQTCFKFNESLKRSSFTNGHTEMHLSVPSMHEIKLDDFQQTLEENSKKQTKKCLEVYKKI